MKLQLSDLHLDQLWAKTRRGVLYGLYLLGFLLLQNVVFSHIAPLGVRAMFMPALVVAVALFEGGYRGGLFGLAAGIVCDLYLGGQTILFTVMFPIVGFAVGLLTDFYLNRRLFTYVVMSVLALFLAAVFALSMYALFLMERVMPVTTAIQDTGAGLEVRRAATGMRIYDDPSTFTSYSLMRTFIAAMAVFLVWRERRFLATLSFTRRGILLNCQGFLLVLALLMVFFAWLLPVLGRGVLWLCGFQLERDWSVELLLTGGLTDWWVPLVEMLTTSLMTAGLWTLIGAVWVRWWKPLLLILAACVALLFLMAAQVRWLNILTELQKTVESWIIWFFDTALPFLTEMHDRLQAQMWQRLAVQVGIGLAGALLSYPVTRWVKNVR